jgi:uncharacterized membrane protein
MSKFDDDYPSKSIENKHPAVTGPGRPLVIFFQKLILLLTRHWLFGANTLAAIILGLGFLAPILLSIGLSDEAQIIYRFLAPHNHQLPQRSYFLFGETGGLHTYSLDQIVAQGADPQHLQTFVGNSAIGFKTALNHRMIAIFTAIFGGGLAWSLMGRQPRVSFSVFFLLMLPLLIDGFSHLFSERSGLGFRERNTWAVTLTGHIFPPTLYTGTTFGTLNWFLRTLTGALFGLALVWFLYAYLDQRFKVIQAQLEPKLRRSGAIQ